MSRQFTRPSKPAHGSYDWTQFLAQMHRPTGEALQAEIRRMHSTGLTDRDIAASLRIGVGAVQQALRADGSPT
jgi:hypothetical protein